MIGKTALGLCAAALLLGIGAAQAQEFRFEAVPLFENCGDASLQKAKQDGITLGISPSPPYSSLDPGSKKAEDLDVEINEAALKWIGVTNIRYEVMPFGQLIPACCRIASMSWRPISM